MKKREAIKQVREHENVVESNRIKKVRELEAKMDLEVRESNYSRARSITVGTAFGGTTEIMMRGDGGRHLWCLMQPVEVVELLHQLAANVGCNIDVKPRKDFSSWRDWRVSEAEKKHLNGHAPFPNDMAVFQKLGASGYDDEEAKRIMNILSDIKEFANEQDESEIILQDTKISGAPSVMFNEEDQLVHNKLAIKDGEFLYMAGGNGGTPVESLEEELANEAKYEAMATNKPADGRKTKRTTKSA